MRNFSGILPNPSTRHAGHGSKDDYTTGLPDNDIRATKKRDRLTGVAKHSNTFSYEKNSLSILKNYDTITNYVTTDAVDSPFVTSGSIVIDLGTPCEKISALSARAISKECLSKEDFKAGQAGAFTVEGFNGTFVVLNDNKDGFQANSDAIIFLDGYQITGTSSINVV